MSYTTKVHLFWYCKYASSYYGETGNAITTDCKPSNKPMNKISWLQLHRVVTYTVSQLFYQFPFLLTITLNLEKYGNCEVLMYYLYNYK